MKHPLRRAMVLVAGLLVAGSAGAKTGFGLPLEDEKTVVISDRVGQNQIRFVSTAPLEEIHGTASGISGSLTLDPNSVNGLTGTLRVRVESMETGIDRRDKHLYSKDWLDAERYPEILFELKGLKDVEPANVSGGRSTLKGTATGAFTLHGVTEDLETVFEATYIQASEATAKRAPGDLVMIKSSFVIALKDYDIKGVRGLVGRKVGKTIDVDVSLFGSTALDEGEE